MKKYFLLLCAMFLMHGVFAQNVMRISFKDNTYKDYDVTTIDSVSWFFKEPQIRNLIGCSGTMPEKLQGSFSSTRSLYKRNVRRHKTPLPHKAA